MEHIRARMAARRQGSIGLIVVVLLLPAPICADTITIGASRDTTLYRDNPGNSDGAGQVMLVGNNGQSSSHRALMGFDIAGNLPAGAMITDVQLTLVVNLAAPG